MSYTQNNEPYNDNVIKKLLNDNEIENFLKKIKKDLKDEYITDFNYMLENRTTNEENFFK